MITQKEKQLTIQLLVEKLQRISNKKVIFTEEYKDNGNFGPEEFNLKSSFNLEPKFAFKLYNILKGEFPEIAQEFTQSAFFTFLNDNLK